MSFVIRDRRFEVMWFSDVSTRDGAGFDLWEHRGEEKVQLAEVFRHDDLKRFDFSAFEIDIPLEAIEKLLDTFNAEGGREFVPELEWPAT